MMRGGLKGSQTGGQNFDSRKTRQCTQKASDKYGKSLAGGTRQHTPGSSVSHDAVLRGPVMRRNLWATRCLWCSYAA